jgi:hypothetical protein
LLYIEERFKKIASCTLFWTTGEELLNGFEEVLIDTTLTNWEDLVAPIADAARGPPCFEQTLQAIMYCRYVGAEAQDIHFEYFCTLQKPMKASMLDHSSRMLTLARYGNKLPGAEPPLTDKQIKNLYQENNQLARSQNPDEACTLLGGSSCDVLFMLCWGGRRN